MPNVRWTKREVYRLMELAETYNRHEIASHTGLHWKTVANRLSLLGIRPKCEYLTLRECVRRTGYLKHQLYRAKAALNQHWRKPITRGQSYGISERQLEALCDYLKSET